MLLKLFNDAERYETDATVISQNYTVKTLGLL